MGGMPTDNNRFADPIYRRSLSELRGILVLWAIFFAWTISYTHWHGSWQADQPLRLVWGMPSWVFWGLFAPWVVAAVLSTWFALFRIADHPLENVSPRESVDD
jgi:hypothetical protein